MSLPSDERVLFNYLRGNNLDKWGWVIYRCTYDDDEGWTRFKQHIIQRSRAEIAESDTPELADSLEWTFVEDRVTLDSASRAQLRSRFNQWALEALKAEQPRAENQRWGTWGLLRYNYFIHVDDGALKSVVDEPPQLPEDMCGEGYVNFVQADWKPFSEKAYNTRDVIGVEEDEGYEPIDGCTEENVGWMKISSRMVGTYFYQVMMDPDAWYVFYKRPEEIVY